MSDNYYKKSGLRQLVPGAHLRKKLTQIKTAAEKEVYGVVIMTTDKREQFQVCPSDPETEATTWSITDTDRIVCQLEREIYGITSNEQMLFKNEFSIRLIQF
jgi:hypothetical protein